MMRNIFKPTPSNEQDDLEPDSSEEEDLDMLSQNDLDGITEANQAMEYDSDTSNDEPMDCEGDEDEGWGDEQPEEGEPSQVEGAEGRSEPEDQTRRKRQKLDVPVLTAHRTARENKRKILESALKDIEKRIRSRKTEFDAGSRGLQSYRAQAIKSYLRLVVRKNYKGIPALEAAAEAFGFAKKMGWSTGQAMGAYLAG